MMYGSELLHQIDLRHLKPGGRVNFNILMN